MLILFINSLTVSVLTKIFIYSLENGFLNKHIWSRSSVFRKHISKQSMLHKGINTVMSHFSILLRKFNQSSEFFIHFNTKIINFNIITLLFQCTFYGHMINVKNTYLSLKKSFFLHLTSNHFWIFSPVSHLKNLFTKRYFLK